MLKVVNNLVWSFESNFIGVSCFSETNKTYGLTIIEISNSFENYFRILHEHDYDYSIYRIKFEQIYENNLGLSILVSGNSPHIASLKNNNSLRFFKVIIYHI